MSEHEHQAAVVRWMDATHPKIAKCLIAYPSGAIFGGKNKWGMINKLKKEGWRSGVSDLFLAVPSSCFHGLWIEMKDLGKTKCCLSSDQIDHLELMSNMGYMAVWCAGSEAAINTINGYLQES